jgi:hypothetical protein
MKLRVSREAREASCKGTGKRARYFNEAELSKQRSKGYWRMRDKRGTEAGVSREAARRKGEVPYEYRRVRRGKGCMNVDAGELIPRSDSTADSRHQKLDSRH